MGVFVKQSAFTKDRLFLVEGYQPFFQKAFTDVFKG